MTEQPAVTAPTRHTCCDQKTAAGPDWDCQHCCTLPSDLEEPMKATLSYSRRAFEADGNVHAARFVPGGFTTACAVYPAPVAVRLDASNAEAVTCTGCLTATEEPTR